MLPFFKMALFTSLVGISQFASAIILVNDVKGSSVFVYSFDPSGELTVHIKDKNGVDGTCKIPSSLAKLKGHDLLTLGSLISSKKIDFWCKTDSNENAIDYGFSFEVIKL